MDKGNNLKISLLNGDLTSSTRGHEPSARAAGPAGGLHVNEHPQRCTNIDYSNTV